MELIIQSLWKICTRYKFKGDGNMNIEYRKLTTEDLDTFIEMRISQLREEGGKEDIDIRPALYDYYKRHMADGTFVSWIAVDDDKIIGTSGMSQEQGLDKKYRDHGLTGNYFK